MWASLLPATCRPTWFLSWALPTEGRKDSDVFSLETGGDLSGPPCLERQVVRVDEPEPHRAVVGVRLQGDGRPDLGRLERFHGERVVPHHVLGLRCVGLQDLVFPEG